MIVSEVMVKSPITVKKSVSLKKAQELMQKNAIRHLPVVDNKGELLGIISESDVRSSFSTSSISSANGLPPSKIKVESFMTQNPLVVFPATHIEDAALIIYKNKIGALPVIKHNKLVGIVSVMDMLGLFIDIMGILHSSSRVDVVMGKDPNNFDKVSKIIRAENLNIITVGMAPYKKSGHKQVYSFRLDLCQTQKVVDKIKKAGFQVIAAID